MTFTRAARGEQPCACKKILIECVDVVPSNSTSPVAKTTLTRTRTAASHGVDGTGMKGSWSVAFIRSVRHAWSTHPVTDTWSNDRSAPGSKYTPTPLYDLVSWQLDRASPPDDEHAATRRRNGSQANSPARLMAAI